MKTVSKSVIKNMAAVRISDVTCDKSERSSKEDYQWKNDTWYC